MSERENRNKLTKNHPLQSNLRPRKLPRPLINSQMKLHLTSSDLQWPSPALTTFSLSWLRPASCTSLHPPSKPTSERRVSLRSHQYCKMKAQSWHRILVEIILHIKGTLKIWISSMWRSRLKVEFSVKMCATSIRKSDGKSKQGERPKKFAINEDQHEWEIVSKF